MTERTITINEINTLEDLLAFYDSVSLEYGDVLVVRLIDKNSYVKEFRNKEEIKENLKDSDFEDLKAIIMSIYNVQKEVYVVDVDQKTNQCKITKTELTDNVSEIEQPLAISSSEEEKLISDPGYDYYKFDNGVYVRYGHENHLYYKTNRDYEWVQDNGVLSWFMDSEHNYETLKKNENRFGK